MQLGTFKHVYIIFLINYAGLNETTELLLKNSIKSFKTIYYFKGTEIKIKFGKIVLKVYFYLDSNLYKFYHFFVNCIDLNFSCFRMCL